MAKSITTTQEETLIYQFESAAGAADLDGTAGLGDFTIRRDAELDHVAVEMPAASGFTLTAVYPLSGPSVLLVTAAAAVTTAIYLEGKSLGFPVGTVLQARTSGGVSGDKKVSITARRIDS
jgi:hypothetical protein